jgi:glycosyltransferase involved in cell wall biosynthesis
VVEDDAEENFVMLLQAFSKFKKWQQSSMQLLVLPKNDSFAENIQQKFKTYKYRDDVRLLEELDESQLAPILASAYALVHVSGQPDLMVLVTALRCALPVITYKHDEIKETVGDAALYAMEKNAEAISNCLIQLYKDENLHAQLRDAAKERGASQDRGECEMKLWKLMQTAAHS